MSTEYNAVKIGDVATLISGRDLLPSQINDKESGFPYITGASSIINGRVVVNRWTNEPVSVSEKGDILITCKGTVGLTAYNTIGQCHIARQLMAIRPNLSLVDDIYLKFAIDDRIYHIIKLARSLIPGVSRNDILSLDISLPPLPEQKRIAEILTAADSAIDEADRAVKESERAKQGMMQKLILDSEDELKEGWTVGTISDIAVISPKINKSHLTESTSVSFIPMASISESGKVIEMEVKKYSEVKSGFTSFEDGDVLFAKITPCMENGKGALVNNLVNGVGFGSTEFFVLRAIESASNEFLYQITVSKFFRHKALSYLKGTAGQQRVSRELFTMLNFPIPPLPEQKHISEILSVADEKIELCKQRKAILVKTKQGLMQKLLGGIDV